MDSCDDFAERIKCVSNCENKLPLDSHQPMPYIWRSHGNSPNEAGLLKMF